MKGKKVLEAGIGGATVSVEFTDGTAASFFVDESVLAHCIDYDKLNELIERLEPENVTDLYIEDQNGAEVNDER